MGTQTDHDTVVTLVEQGRQVAALLAKHDVRQDEQDKRITSLEMSRVKFLATVTAMSTGSAGVVGILVKHFWPNS